MPQVRTNTQTAGPSPECLAVILSRFADRTDRRRTACGYPLRACHAVAHRFASPDETIAIEVESLGFVGIRFRVDELLEEGQTVIVELDCEGIEPQRWTCNAVRVEPAGGKTRRVVGRFIRRKASGTVGSHLAADCS